MTVPCFGSSMPWCTLENILLRKLFSLHHVIEIMFSLTEKYNSYSLSFLPLFALKPSVKNTE